MKNKSPISFKSEIKSQGTIKINKKFAVLFSLLLAGCTSVVTTNPPVTGSPSAKPSATATISGSATPAPSTTVTPSTTPTIVMSATPTPNPTSTPVISAQSGLVQLTSGYIKSPNTAFLVGIPFNFNTSFSIDALPPQNVLATIFDLYDDDAVPKKSHFSLSIFNNKFLVKADNGSASINKSIDFSISTDQNYELNFSRLTDKIEISINGKVIFSEDFKGDDFRDKFGKRVLVIGSDLSASNSFLGKIDYIDVKDVFYYDFKKNFYDKSKYRLDALGFGSFKFISDDPIPVNPQPTVFASATPSPTAVPTTAPERTVTDRSGRSSIDLGVYDSKDITKLNECLVKREGNKNINLDCYDESGLFTTPGFDLGNTNFLPTDLGDFRFITDVQKNTNVNRITIAGSSVDPKVYIIDIGPKIFDGIDAKYLAEKVDYTNAKKIYSDSNISSPVITDHIYAIKTYRYGKEPRYAKLVVNNIITNDFKSVSFDPPTILSQPSYVPSETSSGISSSVGYTYYISTYDGFGETAPLTLATLPAISTNENLTENKVKISFSLPYGAKGYDIYRRNNKTSEIYRLGPILNSTTETQIDFFDYGKRGILEDSISTQNTTQKSAFRPAFDSKPKSLDFTYSFDGDGNLSY